MSSVAQSYSARGISNGLGNSSIRGLVTRFSEGFGLSNLYLIDIEPPKIVNFPYSAFESELLCCNASFPFKKLIESRQFINNIEKKYATGSDTDPVKLSFYCAKNESFGSRPIFFFSNWMEQIYARKVGATSIDDDYTYSEKNEGFFSYPNVYKGGLSIILVDENGKKYYTAKLFGAYPTNITQIPLGFDSVNNVIRLEVDFNYDRVVHTYSELPSGTGLIPPAAGDPSFLSKLGSAASKAASIYGRISKIKQLATAIMKSVPKNTNQMKRSVNTKLF